LVNPQGQPVGNPWQGWANEMRVPTVRRLILDVSAFDAANFCGSAGACSMGWEPGQARETIVAPDAGRQALYYELGHQFDWRYLNAGDRRYLARAWGVPGARWRDSAASVDAGAEDGLEAVFPEIYADCADGINDQGNDISVGFINSAFSPPGVTPTINTCTYLARVAVKRHAAVAGWRHWHYIPAADVPAPVTRIG
jgi:hypothetical protein